MLFRRQLILALVLALTCGPAYAATFHVHPEGGDAAAGSELHPWRSIQHAANVAGPGDTVLVGAGLYRESVVFTVSGTPDAAITFSAAPGAILESPDSDASLSALDVRDGVGHLILEGFEARGGYHETVFLRGGSHHVSVRDCLLHGNVVGLWIAGSDVAVERCAISGNSSHGLRILGAARRVSVSDTSSTDHDDGRGCDGDADGFIAERTVSDVTFSGCLASGNGEDGFDLAADRVHVERSVSQGNACSGIKLAGNARVENSIVSGNRTGILAGAPAESSIWIEILNSVVADNSGTQILLRSPQVPAESDEASGYGVVIRNVIAHGPAKAVEVETSVALTEDHNLLFRDDTTSGLIVVHRENGEPRRYSGQEINSGVWTAESGQGAATLAVDPDFADAEQYLLAADSSAIDGGDAAEAPGADLNLEPRPRGNDFDIGPYEAAHALDNRRPWADPGPDRTVVAGSNVTLTALGSVDPDGDPLEYSWDFGDGGEKAQGYEVHHSWIQPGAYVLELTVSDGALSRSRSAHIEVVPPPTYTATPWQAPTATPTPHRRHDAVVLPPRPVRVRIPAGREEVSRDLTVRVRNGDPSGNLGPTGHAIRLTAADGTCPPGTVAGPPDFGPRAAGGADVVSLRPGAAAAARVSLRLRADAFDSVNKAAPRRCRLVLTAAADMEGNEDPTPDNDRIEVEIDVVDAGDAPRVARHESVIETLNPQAFRIPRGQRQTTRKIAFRVANADVVPARARPGHEIRAIVDEGDCPRGTVRAVDMNGPDAAVLVPGGRKQRGTVEVTVDRDAFLSSSANAPARCTARISVAGPDADSDPSNDETLLVIDVIDRNDF
jgi:hypothetical protein